MRSAEQPSGVQAEFLRSSYWRQGDSMYSVVKVRMGEIVPYDAAAYSSLNGQIDALREEHQAAEDVIITPARDGQSVALRYDTYMFADSSNNQWAVYPSPAALSENPMVQKRAMQERTIMKRQEKYLGEK